MSMKSKRTSGTHDVNSIMNRRAFPRWPMTFEVKLVHGRETISADPIEIGEGGLSFLSNKALPMDSETQVEFRLNPTDNWIKVKCVVRHSSAGKLGVEFLNLRMADRLKIVDFMMAKQ